MPDYDSDRNHTGTETDDGYRYMTRQTYMSSCMLPRREVDTLLHVMSVGGGREELRKEEEEALLLLLSF
jgi:hypothetical protein